jgi:hypothetical protein
MNAHTPALYSVQYRTLDGDTFAIGIISPETGRPQMYAEHVLDTTERTRVIETAVARLNAQILELATREGITS